MATTFPTSLQDLDATRGTTGQPLNAPNHITHHTLEDDTIEALQAKVGADGSAVTTSHDYKLSGVTGSDKATSLTGTETLTNKTLGTGSKVALGSDATGDIYYRHSDGTLKRLAIGSASQVLNVNSGVPAWRDETAVINASTTVKGVVEGATAAEITAGTATGGTGAVLAVTPDQFLLSSLGKMVLLKANSGTSTSTSTTNVDTIDLSGLTAKDSIVIYWTASAVTQPGGNLALYHQTDGANIIGLLNNVALAAGQSAGGTVILRQEQQNVRHIFSTIIGIAGGGTATGASGTSAGGTAGIIQCCSIAVSTDWTSAWTIGFRNSILTSGSTLAWSWSVYKVSGQ